jgi:hypothetical protein
MNRRDARTSLMCALFCLLCWACSVHRSTRGDCLPFQGKETSLEMWSSDSSYVIAGTVILKPLGQVSVVATSAEGTREPIDAPIKDLRLSADSLSFGFAPINYELKGRCENSSQARGTFSVPQPPFGPITGRWVIRPK